MTVSSTSSRVVHTGNGATTSFPFAFKVKAASDLAVVFTDEAGADFILSSGQYGATGFGQDAGGTVTYPLSGSPIAMGTRLTIYRDVAVTQPTQVSNQGAMWPAVIEAALDRLTYIAQKVTDGLSRALTVSPTDGGSLAPLPNATQRANSVLGFDAQGQPYAAQIGAGLVAASSWLTQNFFPVASAAAARTVLEAPSSAEMAGADDLRVLKATLAAKGSTYAATAASAPAELAVGANGTVAMADSSVAVGLAYVAPFTGTITGLTWANNAGDAANDLDIAAGGCMSDDGTTWIAIAATTKQSDVAGAADNGATPTGMLDTGTVGDFDYWLYAIKNPASGATRVLSVKSGETPVLPAGFTRKRRFGWFRRSSGAIQAFKVYEAGGGGIELLWSTPALDVDSALADTNRRLDVVCVPVGVSVEATLNVESSAVSTTHFIRVSCPDQADTAPHQTNAPLHNTFFVNGGTIAANQLRVRTDSSGRIASRSTASTSTYKVVTEGFRWARRS